MCPLIVFHQSEPHSSGSIPRWVPNGPQLCWQLAPVWAAQLGPSWSPMGSGEYYSTWTSHLMAWFGIWAFSIMDLAICDFALCDVRVKTGLWWWCSKWLFWEYSIIVESIIELSYTQWRDWFLVSVLPNMDFCANDFAICDFWMKIVFWWGIEDRENGSFRFLFFLFIQNVWNFWFPKLTCHSIHSSFRLILGFRAHS